MKIGVFGGTFDPPHVGHLIVATEAAERLGLDRVLLVPASIPPHKRHRSTTDPALRLEMVRAAVTDDPLLEVSTIELDREGASYTVDTLRALKEEHAEAELFLLIGADQWAEFDTWRSGDEVRRLATICVLERQGESGAVEGDVVHVPVTRIDLSSSWIRARVARGLSIRHMVSDRVLLIVSRAGLYR